MIPHLPIDARAPGYSIVRMRFIVWLGVAAMLVGCAGPGHKKSESTANKENKPVVTLDTALTGRVTVVNAHARFVVLNFPVGTMPGLGQQLNVYRKGLKVGELKANGPQTEDNIVADITAGEALPGDEVRSN